MFRGILAITVIGLLAVVAPAADDRKGDTKARASVAIAAAKAQVLGKGPALAPVPRPIPQTWTEATRAANADGRPVLVYVGCQPPRVKTVTDSHAIRVDKWEGYAEQTIVVCYPNGTTLVPAAKVACDAKASEVTDAVKQAASKAIKQAKLDWS